MNPATFVVNLASHGIDESLEYQITSGKGLGLIGKPFVGRDGQVYLFDGTANAPQVPLNTFHERTRVVTPE